MGGGPRGENVLVFHLPYELDNEAIKAALMRFGPVHSVRHQHHPETDIHTGTRIVRMIREAPIPRHFYVDDWSAKVWYRGQPVECDICGEGHVSRVCPLRGKCRFCKEAGHFARNCPNRDRDDWGEVPPVGATATNGEGGPAVPAGPAPSNSAGADLRDNQLDELFSSVASGSAAPSDSLEGATVVSPADSLEGATVVSQEQSPVSQSVLAGLTVPNLPNSGDAPNSNDCIDLSSSINLLNEGDESSITLNNHGNGNASSGNTVHSNESSGNNESETYSNVVKRINGNSNASSGIIGNSTIYRNESSGNNESIIHSNGNEHSESLPDNEMTLDVPSDCDSNASDDPEIRSDASITSSEADVSPLDSVHSVDQEGFVVPLPKRAPRSSRKPAVVVSPGRSRTVASADGNRSRSVSPADGGRSRSPSPAGGGRSRPSRSSGKHSLPPVVGPRPKSRRS